MASLTLMGAGGVGTPYYLKVLQTVGANLVAYYPLWEPSGATANDLSGNSRNGAYTGVTLGQAGMGDGNTSPLFDATTSKVNVYSASLAGAFNGDAGTLAIFYKPSALAILTDGTARPIFKLASAAGPYCNVSISRTASANQLALTYYAESAYKTVNPNVYLYDNWNHLALTWNKAEGRVRGYFNGVQVGADVSTLGQWSGALGAALCNVGPIEYGVGWSGWLAHAVIASAELTPAEIFAISAPVTRARFLILGDSISIGSAEYPNRFAKSYRNGWTGIYNRAVGATTIVSHLGGQATAGASDPVDHIIVAMGTNDSGAPGDQAAISTAYGNALTTLITNHPAAQIHCVEVLPRGDGGGGSGDVRSQTIRAAALAKGITSWQTDGWIDPTAGVDTADGVHPNASGGVKIAAQIVARL